VTRPCDMLPPVRGTLVREAPLKELVWFRAGGPADVLFRPADVEDLASFLAARPTGLGVQVIGVGSNLLVRDGGIPGAVVRLPASFGKIETDGTRLRVGAAALDANVAKAAADAGIAGMEFLRGVPGTVGGALRMNAGCYGREIADIFVEATALDAKGNKITLTKADMGFVYRHIAAAEDLTFLEAVFEGTHGRTGGEPRSQPAHPCQDRRLDLQESTRPESLGIDRQGGLPRADAWRRPGERKTLQFPDQYGRGRCRRYRSLG